MKTSNYCLLVSTLMILVVSDLKGQNKIGQDSVKLLDMSFDDLMNVKILSVSKKTETLFDASLSASVLTREEIRNAGATSIMEALRLLPGVIVREQSNGNYDIHIRGLDNVPPNSQVFSSTNTTTLVMINNRPVYNHLQGGTFWESLPIDLNNVEKIEVVRGPASTLYGPNAVSGVINIITRKTEKRGLSTNGSVQSGSQNTSIANASVRYQFTKKFDAGISGNYQTRGRDVRYFDFATSQWVTSANDLSVNNPNERYPNPDKSMIKGGVNTFVHYAPNEKAQFNVASGFQNSQVQDSRFDNPVASMSTVATNSRYIDFQSSTYGLQTQVSYVTAVQSPALGTSTYDYKVLDASLEYDLNFKNLSLKPGIIYRSAVYDDGAYTDVAAGTVGLIGKQAMETFGVGLRFDYKILKEKLRFTGGVRMDKFTLSPKWVGSYQAAASYKFNDKNLLRFVYSKAYRAPFILDAYLNYLYTAPAGPGIYTQTSVVGNKNLALLNSNMIEVGYRSRFKSNISLDIEAYFTETWNYSALIQGTTQMTPANFPIVATTEISVENIPLEVEQVGTSISLTIVAGKFQIKPFVTFQKTTLLEYSPYFSTSSAAPIAYNNFDPAGNNVNSGIGSVSDHKFTPKAYGGAYVNYNFNSKFNFNLNAYCFTQQIFYQRDNITYQDGVRGVANIDGKVILNAKLAYMPIKGLSVFISGKNILDRKSIEYYYGDPTARMILLGMSFDF